MYISAVFLLSGAVSATAAAAAAAVPAIPAARLPGSFHPCIEGFAVMNEWSSPRIGIRCDIAIPQAQLSKESTSYALVQQAPLTYVNFEGCANACSEAAEAMEGSCCAAQFVQDDLSCLFVESRTGKCGVQSTFLGPERVGHQVALVLKH